jgi:hypothetical protein
MSRPDWLLPRFLLNYPPISLGAPYFEAESKGKMTMKSMTNRIKCEDAKAANAAFVRVPSCRFHLQGGMSYE